MKNFKGIVRVEVAVDSIANHLLSTFNEDNKHRESITETIIGSLMETNNQIGLSHLYNSLNGFSNEIEFKVGDLVVCTDEIYRFSPVEPGEEGGEITYEREYSQLGQCTVVRININKSNKLEVEYNDITRSGNTESTTRWVSHLACDRVPADNEL